MDTGVVYPGVKWQRLETDKSSSSAEVKNGGAITPVPHTFSWRGYSLIKPRNKFTFNFSLHYK
jgi:hypothetical protein